MSSDPRALIGSWTLARRLVDRRSGQHGTVRGTLEITPELRWREAGQLCWGGALIAVTRELRIVPDGAGWTVCFSDGRPFHPWRPGEYVHHPCRADLYQGLIDIGVARWRVLWDVTGPAKDQRIITRFSRRTGSPSVVRAQPSSTSSTVSSAPSTTRTGTPQS